MPGYPIKICWSNRKSVSVRYTEHISAIRSKSGNSGYSNHILNTGHTYGAVTDSMDVIRAGRKGRHLNTLGKCHIYKIGGNSLHLNDTHIETHNPICQTLHKLYDRELYTGYLERYLRENNHTRSLQEHKSTQDTHNNKNIWSWAPDGVRHQVRQTDRQSQCDSDW
jgi:hypothetical protein